MTGMGVAVVMPPDVSRKVLFQTKRNAEESRNDPSAAAEIEAMLARNGFDIVAVTAMYSFKLDVCLTCLIA